MHKFLVLGRTPFYQTSNELEHHFAFAQRSTRELKHVHILVIELEHPIFGFKRTKFEH